MKKILIVLCGFMITIYSFIGCKNDKAELVYPEPCDTAVVTYSNTILPILRDNCYKCHAGSQTVGPFNLDSYAAVSVRAASGELEAAVFHLPGVTPMPKDADQLSPCDLGKIKKWLDEGYPDN